MTLIEVFAVVAGLFILAALLLAFHDLVRRRSSRLNCVSNVKQINLAFRIWAGDNGNLYPMGVPSSIGGAMELIATGNVASCFRVASNELSTTKILVCPDDPNRTSAINFDSLNRSHISYFIGVDVTNDSNPNLILDGDDHLELNGIPVKSGLLNLPTNAALAWIPGRHDEPSRIPYLGIPTRHHFYGNLGFADGSVAEESTAALQTAFFDTAQATNRLAIP